MKYTYTDLEPGKEYLAVDKRDSRNEVGIRVVLIDPGLVEVMFTRGTWNSFFKSWKPGDELALFESQTEFFDFPHLDTVKCRACPARVIFLETEDGKKIPVNADTVLPKDRIFNPAYHRTHFADCPAATTFRKKETHEHRESKPKRRTGARGTRSR